MVPTVGKQENVELEEEDAQPTNSSNASSQDLHALSDTLTLSNAAGEDAEVHSSSKPDRYQASGWTKDWNEPGVRHWETLRVGERQPFLRALIAIVTLTIYVGWINILISLFFWSCFSTTCLYITLALFSTLLLPAKPVLWPSFNTLDVLRMWREYHRFSYLIEEPMDPSKRLIFVQHPHGTFPLGPILSSGLVQNLFPEISVFSVAADAVFTIPLWRHIIAWVGAMPATAKNMKHLLTKGICAVVLGGIAEMYMLHPEKECIKLRGRKGFAKVAIEAQIDAVVPVYYFGNSQCLDFGPRRFFQAIARKWRVALSLYIYGRWCIPCPRPVPLFMVHGRHLPVPKVNLSDKEAVNRAVDELHEATVQEMQRLYDTYKAEYGWADRPLVIE